MPPESGVKLLREATHLLKAKRFQHNRIGDGFHVRSDRGVMYPLNYWHPVFVEGRRRRTRRRVASLLRNKALALKESYAQSTRGSRVAVEGGRNRVDFNHHPGGVVVSDDKLAGAGDP